MSLVDFLDKNDGYVRLVFYALIIWLVIRILNIKGVI